MQALVGGDLELSWLLVAWWGLTVCLPLRPLFFATLINGRIKFAKAQIAILRNPLTRDLSNTKVTDQFLRPCRDQSVNLRERIG